MKIYKDIIKNDDLCFDIGANNGNKTQEMLECGAKIICLEPQDNCISYLSNRFRNNDKIIIIQKACSDKEGTSSLFISNSHTLSTMSKDFIEEVKKERFSDKVWNEEKEIKTTTLDILIEKYGMPSFCKIDVEGFESEVLKGLSKSIKYLSMEFTPEFKKNTFLCMDILMSIDKYSFNYSEGESNVFEFKEWINYDEMKKFLIKNNDFKYSFGDLYAKKNDKI